MMECFPVPERVAVRDPRVLERIMPAEDYLSIIHTDPFSGVVLAWTLLLSYEEGKKYTIT